MCCTAIYLSKARNASVSNELICEAKPITLGITKNVLIWFSTDSALTRKIILKTIIISINKVMISATARLAMI